MKMTTATEFFSSAERELIHRAIVAAELNTSGEIVPIVVDRSDRYREAELAAAIVISALLGLLLLLLFQHDSIWWFFPLAIAVFIPVRFLIGRMPYLTLPFISLARMEQAVRESALRSFYENGLHRTEGETGVLIFISLFERRVWILGDRGINSRIAQVEWQGMVDQLIHGIRDGNPANALCAVINDCGKLLHAHFPKAAEDSNELSDEVITS